MDFVLQWLLIGLPIAFAFGWIAARVDLRQVRRAQTEAPRAYFEGLNLLLNEQHDKAIDAFIAAVQQDPDTTELHFALGNLFRRRGEFERAVRVHQHLLNRGDLKAAERQRAQHALAQDFMKAGLFDRAEAAYKALEGTDFDSEARLALLSVYERSRDWRSAVDIATRLERGGTGSFASRIAHYWCELALEADEKQQPDEADSALRRAHEVAPQAARPLVLAGQRKARVGAHAEALQWWSELRQRNPAAFNLVASEYAESALACGQADAARVQLASLYERFPSIDVVQALARLEGVPAGRSPRLVEQLRRQPTLSAAHELLATPVSTWTDEGLAAVREAVARAARPLRRYRCAACGFEAQHHFWQCPGCLNWDSYPPQRVEEI